MIKYIYIIIFLVACGSSSDRNDLMTSLINKKKVLNDSLEFYKGIDNRAKISVDTLTHSDLLRVGSDFLAKQQKIRLELIPKVASLEKELSKIDFSIDSLSKLK